MNVVTDSFIVERDATGRTIFKFTKQVNWGSFMNGPDSVLSVREFNMGSLQISPEQTEEEFLSEISRLANIVKVIYS